MLAIAAERIQSPADCMALVAADRAVDRNSAGRYIWCPPWIDQRQCHVALILAVNTAANHSPVIVQPAIGPGGSYQRWNLLELAGFDRDVFQRLAREWDKIAILDERFYANVAVGFNSRRKCPHCSEQFLAQPGILEGRCRHCGGRWRFKSLPKIRRGYAPSLGEVEGFAALSGSRPLMCSADVFINLALRADGDGRYYQLRGIPKTRAELLKQLGVDERYIYEVGGDQRAGLIMRGPTGRPGQVIRIQGQAGRNNTAAIWFTRDIDKNTDRADRHPLLNLVDFRHDGEETIWEWPNGFHGFAAYDGQGRRVDAVPIEIATDTDIPSPGTMPRGGGSGSKVLVPAMSCITCHGVKASGLHPVQNDVLKLLGGGYVDVIADFSDPSRSHFERLQNLAGMYGGIFERRLQIGRTDYSLAVRRATEMDPKQEPVKVASRAIQKIYYDYRFDLVTPQRALLELGVDCENEESLSLIRQMLLPQRYRLQAAAGMLLTGMSVQRDDFRREYSVMSLIVNSGANQ